MRSLPGSYSYFNDGGGGGRAAAISAGTVVKRNGGSDSFVKVESMPPDDDAGMDADGKNGAEGVNESAAVLSSGEAVAAASTTTTSGEYPVQEATAEAVKSKEVKTEGPGDAEIKEVDEVSVAINLLRASNVGGCVLHCLNCIIPSPPTILILSHQQPPPPQPNEQLQQVPYQPASLIFTHIPLPILETTTDNDSNNNHNDAYSKFCTPVVTKDSRNAKFVFSLNYETHVPGKSLISSGGVEDSGYVLQLPVVMGTVVGYSPPLSAAYGSGGGGKHTSGDDDYPQFEFEIDRQKEDEPLFRILWDGSAEGIGYMEDMTLSELLPCLVSHPVQTPQQRLKHRRKSGSDSIPQESQDGLIVIPSKLLQSHASSVHKHVHATVTRKQLSLEWKMENEILPQLVVMAGLELRKEIAQQIRLTMLLERKRLRVACGVERGGKKKSGGAGDDVNPEGKTFEYYSRHPNQYMPSFVPPPPLPSDDEDEEDEDIGGEHKTRSKTKLTKAELAVYNEKVDEQCQFAPSKLAERVKLACSIAFDYASRRGLLDNYYLECDQRKERERLSTEHLERTTRFTAGGSSSRWAVGFDGMGEVRRSSRAKSAVNYADDGTQVVEDVLNQHEFGQKSGGVSFGGAASTNYPREDVGGGPTARFLLRLMGWMPQEVEDAQSEAKEEGGDEEMDADEEEEDIEEDEDPFFEPDHCLIIDQLGRKHRYMSPANIQDAIVRTIEGEPVETPKCLLDEEQVEEMESTSEGEAPVHFVTDMVCTTDDRVSDLPQFEPSSFARCRFAPRTFIAESEEVEAAAEEDDEAANEKDIQVQKLAKAAAKQRKEERRRARLAAEQKRNAELERHYRARKAYELWRFKSIHGDGCTIWPLWSERAQSLLKEFFVMSRVNSTASLAASAGGEQKPTGEGIAISNNVASVATAEAPANGEEAATSVSQSDEALARSLAAAENVAAEDEPLTKRRRVTRRAAGGDEPVFYGSHQSMSRDQLLSTLVRILRQAKPGSSSIMDLKRLVFATDYDSSRGEAVEWKKLRSALGHIVFRLGKVGRLIVDTEGDLVCWDLLKEGALVKFATDTPQAMDIVAEETEAVDPAVESDAVAPQPPVMDELTVKRLSALEKYVQRLHFTELSLRSALMKAIDKGGESGESLLQISTVAIATAADETEGDADSEVSERY